MSQDLDSYLMSIGVALSRKQIDVTGAMKMLSTPEIVDNVDGTNIQQLIRLSLKTAQIDPHSSMIAEVGVMLTIAKPGIEIDFGLQVGVANAQTCALFAMFSIVFQQRNASGALVILHKMISSLRAANDKKGLLEVLCWIGVLHDNVEDYTNATKAFSAAIGLLEDPETAAALPDSSALDMVRADNRNVFSFPILRCLEPMRSPEVATALRELLSAAEAQRRP
jgi:hypothetical protein